jgi:uncharacterized delta-60 repeat protein
MQQETTMYQRMVSGARRLQAVVRHRRGVAALAVVLLLPLNVGALGPGDLDTSFSRDGKVTTDFGSPSDRALALALQPDSKLVVAGVSLASGSNDFALARYHRDGALDTTFGAGGTVRTDFVPAFGGSSDVAYALALQPDGKIVVAGVSNGNGSNDFALARYHHDGALDTTFGAGGTVTTDFGGNDIAYAVALQPDGKIVLAGHSASSGFPPPAIFALARYTATGALDPSFGSGGKVTTDFCSFNVCENTHDQAYALVIQPDGKIVAAGIVRVHGAGVFALARYTTTGDLDTDPQEGRCDITP